MRVDSKIQYFILTAVAVLLGFQNCSGSVQLKKSDNTELGSQSTTTTTLPEIAIYDSSYKLHSNYSFFCMSHNSRTQCAGTYDWHFKCDETNSCSSPGADYTITSILGMQTTPQTYFLNDLSFIHSDQGSQQPGVISNNQNTGVCAVVSGDVYCWGLVYQASGVTTVTPQKVIGLPRPAIAVKLTLGTFACAILDNKDLYCWGNNSVMAALSPSLTPTSYNPPTRVEQGVDDFAFSVKTGLAAPNNNAVACFIKSGSLSCRFSSASVMSMPVPEPVAKIYNLFSHACLLAVSGRAYCFGNNDKGQLGTGNNLSYDIHSMQAFGTPTDRFQDIIVSAGITCGAKKNGEVLCAGKNIEPNQLNVYTSLINSPTRLSFSPVSAITINRYNGNNVCYAKDILVYCYVDNSRGLFGLGPSQLSQISNPVQTPFQ